MSVTMDVNKAKRNRKGNANPKGNANHVAIGKLRDGKKWQQFRKGKGEKPENPLSKKKKAENKTAREDREIEQLEERCKRPIDAAKVEKFSDFPISSATIRGLADVKIKDKDKEKEKAKFVSPTEIQREAIGFALQGRDVLGAAKTGSGKTLAFLIPLLERLFRQKYSPQDGLGAIVISPTRELAHQTFGTLRKVGKFHDFSAGLVIGGHVDHAREGEMMATCNIVVCTPGRLLQHMDESPEFDATNLQVLVLDEADRCLETFFAEQMNAIVSNLPTTRQTMLFSATQTKSVRELARLSLEDPVLVSVHEHAERATPDELKEYYAVCELGQKLDMLHAFLKREIKKKIIVFVSSCKQVKFLLEVLKKLRLYTTVTGLYGTLKQHRRIDIYEDFCQKRSGVLIATDVASRGLDFPRVDWVYQMDCPEDWRAYNHRVGRTARNHKVGRAMMTLLPSEEAAMIKQLTVRRFRLTKDAVDTDDLPSVQKKLQACVAADTELKGSAQRAFTAYLKSTYMMKDKSVFDAFALDTGAFAVSFGLVVPPRVRFLQRRQKKMDEEDNKGNVVDKTKLESVVDHMKSECVVEKTHSENVEGRVKARSKKDQFVFEMSDDSDDDDVGENMLTCKRKDHGLEGGGEVDEVNGEDLPQPEDLGQKKIKTVTKAALAKKALKKNFQINERIQFGEDGETVLKGQSAHKDSDIGKKYESEAAQTAGIDISAAREMIKAEDVFDRRKEREQQKERNKEKKRKLKEAKGKRMSGTTQKAEEGKEEDDPDEGPNLDWLPDPDKVYGKEVGDSSNSESDEEEEYGKRKWKPPKKKKEAAAKKQKLSRVDDEEESEDDSSGNLEYLADQEELALRLLTGR